jgi:hypothetical protein
MRNAKVHAEVRERKLLVNSFCISVACAHCDNSLAGVMRLKARMRAGSRFVFIPMSVRVVIRRWQR